MGLFEKSSLSSILTESYLVESNTSDDVDENELAKELADEYDEVEEVVEESVYTAEMIPVIECGNQFEVDYNDLRRLMDCSHKDEKECLDDVCDHCGIDFDKTYVVIDSDEVMEESVEDLMTIIKEAKSPVKKAKAKLKLKNTKNLFKNLINKGIKVKKKKSKVAKKKKRIREGYEPVNELFGLGKNKKPGNNGSSGAETAFKDKAKKIHEEINKIEKIRNYKMREAKSPDAQREIKERYNSQIESLQDKLKDLQDEYMNR